MKDRCDRVLRKTRYDHGCWLFQGKLDPRGYGRIGHHDGTGLAHRAVYEALRGPISADLALDHLCRNPSCVNPWHLEAVPNAENTRRGIHTKKTHCPKGHEYTPKNTRIKPWGAQECRACGNAATAARAMAKRRAAGIPPRSKRA